MSAEPRITPPTLRVMRSDDVQQVVECVGALRSELVASRGDLLHISSSSSFSSLSSSDLRDLSSASC